MQYLDELGSRFGLEIDYAGSTMGFANFLKRAAARPTFLGTAMEPPPDDRIRVVPIVAPTPLMPWSLMWTGRVPSELIDSLTAGMVTDLAGQLAIARDPEREWLPLKATVTIDPAHPD